MKRITFENGTSANFDISSKYENIKNINILLKTIINVRHEGCLNRALQGTKYKTFPHLDDYLLCKVEKISLFDVIFDSTFTRCSFKFHLTFHFGRLQ